MLWRRSYDVPPPPIDPADEFAQTDDPRYAGLGDAMPATECLKDVVARLMPYWENEIQNDLADGLTVHGMGWSMMTELLSAADRPDEFDYPSEFVRVVELGLTRLEPWWIIEGDLLRDRHRGLRRRYPTRARVPFAVRHDRDDVACFVPGSKQVVLVHDFADHGYEQRDEFSDFNAWLRRAV